MHARLTLAAVLLATALCAAPSSAAWIPNGDSLCTAIGDQSACAIVSDGAGGAVVVWRDRRNSGIGNDLYARSIAADGTLRWGAMGVPICVAPNDQTNQVIASDGRGGAIIAWQDSRASTAASAIYAQRIRANGQVAWAVNGLAVDTSPGYQSQPTIVADGAGGAIIAWVAQHGTFGQIFAQRVDSTGAAHWAANGIPIAPVSADQSDVEAAADGAGGVLLAWYDARSTASGYSSIFAQRIGPSGFAPAPWPADGVPVCDAIESPWIPTIASSDSGGALIVWEDYRDYANTGANIYGQRLSASGAARWAADGIPFCTAAGDQVSPAVVTDGAGGALAAWEDDRLGLDSTTVFGQRMAAGGAAVWTTNGVSFCSGAHRSALQMISDGAGGAIATWVDYRSGVATDIYAQRVNGAGATMWIAAGDTVCVAANDQQQPVLVSDGANGAIIAWHDNRAGSTSTNYDVYAQRLAASGRTWKAAGVDLAAPSIAFQLEAPRPNPSTGPVRVTMRLAAAAELEVGIFDVAGRRVKRLADGGRAAAGIHLLRWDGRDERGAAAAPGIYFVRARAGAQSAATRFVLVR